MLTFKQINYGDTKPFLLQKHYAHRMPSISRAYGVFDDAGILQGIVTFGEPASRPLVVGIAYFGTNVPMDTCLSRGYQGKCLETATGYKCPKCGETNNLQIIVRICGYLGSLNERDLNKGRMKEIEHRVYHNLSKEGVHAPQDIHVMPIEQ